MQLIESFFFCWKQIETLGKYIHLLGENKYFLYTEEINANIKY